MGFSHNLILYPLPSIINTTRMYERKKLIRDIDRTGNKRDYAILMTLLLTGIRVSELVALDRSDVDVSDRKGSMIVRSGKGIKSIHYH
ncbi:tyrosine-type recombinase/integrase [Paenibacillus etheri]|uniref:tyrosine-type recombinase/integrase n=1 Tax=Paenibacillus etheri TaxID=1306852 RepID=UPI000A907F3C